MILINGLDMRGGILILSLRTGLILSANHKMYSLLVHKWKSDKMRMLRRIKGVTLRDRVKSVDIRKELGVSSIQEKVR